MLDIADLSNGTLAFLAMSVFVAGLVRGFTGFAASATVMALATVVMAPIDLLPVCLLLELIASAFLVRGGIKEADYGLTIPLVGFAFIALPAGLYLTKTMDPDLSRLIVLGVVAGLAALQLARIPLPFGRGFASRAVVGVSAGLIQGLANAGGLVHALYVLALDLPPRTVRATMILGVMISGAMGVFWQVAMGILTVQALARVLLVFVPFVIGLWLGRAGFTPENEKFYRPISLALLIVLASGGILRLVV
ncbi:TSUP family transporter [Palleronia caenipelagi]|uniref:Probable membrane transporter protein n=1 Tax=Palleronia caenipelagi TaxID=2489174 RepID=A0A547PJY8_9RHOB|nr:TSUP family transporter [Palleronia caenipelagi]TRD14475.1 sulfite exporter TauE/SafE family protein [Palleronia caenipelagi]